MRSPHRACGIGLLAMALAVAPLVPVAEAAGPSATELVTQADEKGSAGDHAEAARLYKQAFDAMSADERAQLGEVVVETALDSVYEAWEASNDPALLDLTAELIDSFESDMTGTPPAFIEKARAWLEKRRPEPSTTGGAGGDDTPYEDPDVYDDPVGGPSDDGIDGGTETPVKKDVVGPVLVGVGAAVMIGGIVMMIPGSSLGDKAAESRDTIMGTTEYTNLMGMQKDDFDAQLQDFVDSETKRGRGLMIGGGVLLGIGVGLAAYGVVRIVQHRKKKKAHAQVLPTGGGLLVRF